MTDLLHQVVEVFNHSPAFVIILAKNFHGVFLTPGCVEHFAKEQTLYRPVGIPVVDFTEPFYDYDNDKFYEDEDEDDESEKVCPQ